ncbi:DUF998 domain-containing protein [Mycolicibacterium mengxianglii]|uniref:DUF998 domain-containing protein n=1 Tax=Mycolicibacterium mengxianglii TaxID=2736649 RepID=UPI0018D0670E|nr:DUF998 domain-containing protein [Mycolicibacterium mengxianglii]
MLAAALWLVSGLWYLGTEALVAAHLRGYSYSVDFISDLGRPGHSPWAGWMNLAFIQQGVAFVAASFLAGATARRRPQVRVFLGLAVVYGVGSALVGLCHSGVGVDQSAHIVGAVGAIVGGNLALIAAGAGLLRQGRRGCVGFGWASCSLGSVGLACAAALMLNGAADNAVPAGGGFWERGAVYTIIGWQLVAALVLLAMPPPTREHQRSRSAR